MLKDHETINRFTYTTTKIDKGKNYWNYLNVEIFDNGQKIGEYQRNYPSLYSTFLPFKRNNKYYALYSPKYTQTRVMELPSCKDLCGEDSQFCPTGYGIPNDKYLVAKGEDCEFASFNSSFAFVCGCLWGDDNSWKLQLLDLRQIENNILTMHDPFDYLEIWDNDLYKYIDIDCWEERWPKIKVASIKTVELPKSFVCE